MAGAALASRNRKSSSGVRMRGYKAARALCGMPAHYDGKLGTVPPVMPTDVQVSGFRAERINLFNVNLIIIFYQHLKQVPTIKPSDLSHPVYLSSFQS